MIFVACRTSLRMFCDVKPHFSQLLKAHVQYGRPLGGWLVDVDPFFALRAPEINLYTSHN